MFVRALPKAGTIPPGVPRRAFVLAAAAGAALALGVGRHIYQREAAPGPPSPDTAALDPAVAAAVEAARGRVLRSPKSAAAWGRLGLVLAAHDLFAPALACLAEA